MIHQFFEQEGETVNMTYNKIYILNIYANSLNSGIGILCTQQEQKPQNNILNIFMTINLKASPTPKYRSHTLLTKSSEVPNLSSSKDWMRETWTPISLWMPEHSIQVKIPKLVESQVGSVEKILKTNEQTSNFGVPTTEEAERIVVELFKNHKKKI